MTEENIKGLPVPGYRLQSQEAINKVKSFKELEEILLRAADVLRKDPEVDQRWLAIGITNLEQAFMAINRSIFKPTRISLKEDEGKTDAKA